MNHRVNIAARECDTATTKKYRAESLIIVLRRAGQDDLEPYVRWGSTNAANNRKTSMIEEI